MQEDHTEIDHHDVIEGEHIEEEEELLEALSDGQMRMNQEEANIVDYPKKLPIFPLTNRVYMPGTAMPLSIRPGMYYDLLKNVNKIDHKFLGLVLTKDCNQDIDKVTDKDLYSVGVIAKILRIFNLDACVRVILNVESRFCIEEAFIMKKKYYLVAKAAYHKESIPKDQRNLVMAYTASLVSFIKELLKWNPPLFKEELRVILNNLDFAHPWKLCDFIVSLMTASREEMQDILSTFDLVPRMEKTLVLLKKEIEIMQIQSSINQKIEATINKNQRDFFLKEQLKVVQKELGIAKDEKTVDLEKFKARAATLHFTEAARKAFDEEIEKLSILDIQSSEYGVIRGYLDTLTSLPWGEKDDDHVELKKAEHVLRHDHYGLQEVKERILECISVGILRENGQRGLILCFVGPPGVGKTSLGKSIARALQRKFFRISLGGMKDDSEIKGHRRTYVGAMPGRIIQALKMTKVSNPVILLDEIDKLHLSYHGDPASALLEVLDPEQNCSFLDYYVDVPFDLSSVFFITTANAVDSLSRPLLNRMEVLQLSGYTEEEKMHIVQKHLLPDLFAEVGLSERDIQWKGDVLQTIIRDYSRGEAGVRYLRKNLHKIMRKVALKKVENREKKKRFRREVISSRKLKGYLGLPKFSSGRFYGKELLNGVATGLAWTEQGGSILYVEAVKNKGKRRLIVTGNAGPVMKESSNIALSYLLSQFCVDEELVDEEIHIHIPEGAVPKDGPSAGLPTTLALHSLLKGFAISSDIALTGEITLKGKILRIGGVKEKVLAAKREELHHVIMPLENKKDWIELPSTVRRGLTAHFVDHYSQAYRIISRRKL